MTCLRCGRDTGNENVFCNSCRETMEQSPVKSGTPVHLPHRSDDVPVKKKNRRKRPATPEEQISALKRTVKKNRRFSALLILVVLLLLCLIGYEHYQTQETDIGKNYTVDITQPSE